MTNEEYKKNLRILQKKLKEEEKRSERYRNMAIEFQRRFYDSKCENRILRNVLKVKGIHPYDL